MIRRNQRLVFLYYKPNKHLHPEKFVYYPLVLFYLFLKKNDHQIKHTQQNCQIQKSGLYKNKQIFESKSQLIDALLTETLMQDQEKKFIMIGSINLIIKKREGSFTAQTIKINRKLEISIEKLSKLFLTLTTQQRKTFN